LPSAVALTPTQESPSISKYINPCSTPATTIELFPSASWRFQHLRKLDNPLRLMLRGLSLQQSRSDKARQNLGLTSFLVRTYALYFRAFVGR
jgi:hypothetical protein